MKFFMENNNQRVLIFVTIATILILVIIFAGVTYAFFSANNPEGSTAEIKSETGRMLITYNDGTDNIVPVTNIQPSNKILVNKTFTLTGSNTTVGMSEGDGLPMPYKVGVKYTSTFSDGMIHYYIKEVERDTNSQVTANYVITPETGKTEDDYKNQTVPGNDTYTGYTHGTFKKGNKYTEMVTGKFPALKNDQTISFNLIIQFPDNNENQDSEKGKTFNGKIVINYELPKATTFAEDSWETIAKVVQSGQLDAYAVGSEKEVEIAGNSYTVRVANNTTPDECNQEDFSQTACGFVVEFVDILITGSMSSENTNVGGWPTTDARGLANGIYFKSLPSDLQKVIIDTKVVSGHGNSDRNANRTDGNWESEDKIYLLSAHEVWADKIIVNEKEIDTAYGQTRQLDYYADKGVTTSENYSYAIKKDINGNASSCWLRAACSSYDNDFLIVGVGLHGNDQWDNYLAINVFGFAPAFRIG